MSLKMTCVVIVPVVIVEWMSSVSCKVDGIAVCTPFLRTLVGRCSCTIEQ